MGLALRYEDFDTFGSTSNSKLSFLYRATDSLSLRGTTSTGFRAPTPGQANISNISTVADAGGDLYQKGTLAPTNPVSVYYGGKELTPEESTNTSFGFVWDATDALNITFDFYSIELEDRITQGDDISITAADIALLQSLGVPGAGDLTNFRFYVNDFDTTTDGFDIVATYDTEIRNGNTSFTFVYSDVSTEVDRTGGLVGSGRIDQLEKLLPGKRWNLSAVHNAGDWRFLGRMNWVDEWFREEWGGGGGYISDMSTIDLEVSRDLGDYTLTFGAQNAFDDYPDKELRGLILGWEYPEASPLGFNGAFYYFKVGMDF